MRIVKIASVAAVLSIVLGIFSFFAQTRRTVNIPGDLRDAPNSNSALEQIGYDENGDVPVPEPGDIAPSVPPAEDTASAPVPSPVPVRSGGLQPGQETVILVHGANSVGSELDPLDNELKSRGYNVVRFNYNYKQSLETSADEMAAFVLKLRSELALKNLKVIAHSLGGLVSRRAMTVGRKQSLAGLDMPVELITVASPFGGFASANGTRLMPFNMLGITESFRYLGTSRDFIRRPGALGQNITHVKVETDETGQTRALNGKVINDAKVLPENQINAAVDSDPALKAKIILAAGHVGVISDGSSVPGQLLRVLDELGLIKE